MGRDERTHRDNGDDTPRIRRAINALLLLGVIANALIILGAVTTQKNNPVIPAQTAQTYCAQKSMVVAYLPSDRLHIHANTKEALRQRPELVTALLQGKYCCQRTINNYTVTECDKGFTIPR